jgi:hypothetical protein
VEITVINERSFKKLQVKMYDIFDLQDIKEQDVFAYIGKKEVVIIRKYEDGDEEILDYKMIS